MFNVFIQLFFSSMIYFIFYSFIEFFFHAVRPESARYRMWQEQLFPFPTIFSNHPPTPPPKKAHAQTHRKFLLMLSAGIDSKHLLSIHLHLLASDTVVVDGAATVLLATLFYGESCKNKFSISGPWRK